MSTQEPAARPNLRGHLFASRILRMALHVAAGYLVLSVILDVIAGIAQATWLTSSLPGLAGGFAGGLAAILTNRTLPASPE